MNDVTPTMIIVLVAIVVVVGLAVWLYIRSKRTENLRSKFGPEYERAIGEHGDKVHAEAELEQRAKRVARFNIHPLNPQDRQRYAGDWSREQSLFVDNPRAAVMHADSLVQTVMQLRGYPVGEFEQNAHDLSVDHPGVVDNYRIAHEIAVRDAQGQATTEDLRRAMVSYRVLFEELLGQPVERPAEARR